MNIEDLIHLERVRAIKNAILPTNHLGKIQIDENSICLIKENWTEIWLTLPDEKVLTYTGPQVSVNFKSENLDVTVRIFLFGEQLRTAVQLQEQTYLLLEIDPTIQLKFISEITGYCATLVQKAQDALKERLNNEY